MKKLKVFGGLMMVNGVQVRTIVATTSQKRAAELLKTDLHNIRNYWSVTGNKIELEVALGSPETVFVSNSTMTKQFEVYNEN